jgi:DNA invertase Pin-like site-specific DNA recombinase
MRFKFANQRASGVHPIGAFAEFERTMIRQRINAGMARGPKA